MFVSPDCRDGARRRVDGHVTGADELRCIDTLKPRWIALPAPGRQGAERRPRLVPGIALWQVRDDDHPLVIGGQRLPALGR